MKLILIVNGLIVILTLLTGLMLYKGRYTVGRNRHLAKYSIGFFSIAMLLAIGLLVPDWVYAAQQEGGVVQGNGLGYIAAALCTGMATIGAGYAVGAVGSSALGAVSEDPKILGKTLIFVGLAEGIAIYGLIISILILGRLG